MLDDRPSRNVEHIKVIKKMYKNFQSNSTPRKKLTIDRVKWNINNITGHNYYKIAQQKTPVIWNTTLICYYQLVLFFY